MESLVRDVNSHMRQRQEQERLKTIIARIDSYEPIVSHHEISRHYWILVRHSSKVVCCVRQSYEVCWFCRKPKMTNCLACWPHHPISTWPHPCQVTNQNKAFSSCDAVLTNQKTVLSNCCIVRLFWGSEETSSDGRGSQDERRVLIQNGCSLFSVHRHAPDLQVTF